MKIVIPIKQMLLEFEGPMTATTQHQALVPKKTEGERATAPISQNGAAMASVKNSTDKQKPLDNIGSKIIKQQIANQKQ